MHQKLSSKNQQGTASNPSATGTKLEIISGIGVIMEVFEADIDAGHLGNLNKVYQDPLLLLRPFQLWWHLNYIL